MRTPTKVKENWKKAKKLRHAAFLLGEVIYTTGHSGYVHTPDHLRFPGADDKVLDPIESAIKLMIDEAERLECCK